jgi:hypothetical protein
MDLYLFLYVLDQDDRPKAYLAQYTSCISNPTKWPSHSFFLYEKSQPSV